MKEYQSLSHTRWDCKYHIVFIPKRRKKKVFGVLRRHLGEIFHELALHKESKIVEGHMMGDHVHMCLSIPPKYAVSSGTTNEAHHRVSRLGRLKVLWAPLRRSPFQATGFAGGI